MVISNESPVVVVVIVVAPVISVAAFSLILPEPDGSIVRSALLGDAMVEPTMPKSPTETLANDNVPEPFVCKTCPDDPSDVGKVSPANVVDPETFKVPSTINPSFILIDDESVELNVVPRKVT